MADDLLGDLLDLEDGFYKDGYDAGIVDSEYAGKLEGKIFGIEKGYDKALELGKLHGRALVWQRRQQGSSQNGVEPAKSAVPNRSSESAMVRQALGVMQGLPKTPRLEKNIKTLAALSGPENVPSDNSDESVSQVEDAIAKSKAKAKIIAIAAGESLDAPAASLASIEDSAGLSARH
jgi:hypothetical protein